MPTSGFAATETSRLRAHFDGAFGLLARGDSVPLPTHRRARRRGIIEELRSYSARGLFPKNDRLARRSPFFVDAVGTRCAMAHLIERSGHAAIVERIASRDNNARISDLAADQELLDWLDGHGLTLAEAARIQPSYDSPMMRFGEWCDRGRSPSSGFVRATVLDQGHARITSLLGSDTKTVKVGVGDVVELFDNQMTLRASPGTDRFLYPKPPEPPRPIYPPGLFEEEAPGEVVPQHSSSAAKGTKPPSVVLWLPTLHRLQGNFVLLGSEGGQWIPMDDALSMMRSSDCPD